jgi:hypothetical protein
VVSLSFVLICIIAYAKPVLEYLSFVKNFIDLLQFENGFLKSIYWQNELPIIMWVAFKFIYLGTYLMRFNKQVNSYNLDRR